MKQHGESIYDYPRYYDILFAAEWRPEYRFLEACFTRFANRKVHRLFEPACGTGRLLVHFAKAGYEVSGNDLNSKAVDYCNQRLTRHGFPASVVEADMSDFRLRKKVDAAFNTINSFRHLSDERSAENHLRCMAEAIAPGGLYVLGFHLTPRGEQVCEEEEFSARRGRVTVKSRLWTMEVDRRRRQERVGMTMDVSTPKGSCRLSDEMLFRMYSASQFDRLLSRVDDFELVETFDFQYDIENPITVTSSTEDVLYVLRKRKGKRKTA